MKFTLALDFLLINKENSPDIPDNILVRSAEELSRGKTFSMRLFQNPSMTKYKARLYLELYNT